MLDLRGLEVFVAVVEASGMTTAARRLGMTQSAVSQTIIGLEKQVGVTLFDRSLRPPVMTVAGSILYDQARPLLDRAREVSRLVREPVHTALPHLRVGMVDSVAATIGPRLIQTLRDVALHWSVWSGHSTDHQGALLAREVDIVIVSGEVLEHSDRLVRHDVLVEPYFVVLPRSYDGPVDSLPALANSMDLVRHAARSLMGQQIERHLRRVRIEPPPRFELDTADAVMAMVAAGVGWALTTPLCFLQGVAHAGAVRCIPLPGPGFTRRLTLVARQHELGELPERVTRTTIEVLREMCFPVLAQHAPWLIDRIIVGDTRELPL